MGSHPSRNVVGPVTIADNADDKPLVKETPRQTVDEECEEENSVCEKSEEGEDLEQCTSGRTVHELEDFLQEVQSMLEEAEERARDAEMKNAELHLRLKECQLLASADESMLTKSSPVVLSGRSRSADAKEQFIHKLSGELGAMQKEMSVMKNKYEKKLQKLRNDSAKSRAEMSLAMFELHQQQSLLKDENSQLGDHVAQLKQERDLLLGKLCIDNAEPSGTSKVDASSTSHRCPKCGFEKTSPVQDEGDSDGDVDETAEDSRMQLILDLSQQVSSLNGELDQTRSRIRQLETQRQT